MNSQSTSTRYEMLDAYRGVAASGVVIGHLQINLGVDLGVICVMMFFVISGYCITASAEAARRRGDNFRAFMLRRFHRIYPPYVLSVLFFVATRLLKTSLGQVHDLDGNWLHWIETFTLTQWVTLFQSSQPAPFINNALFVVGYWSLNYEEQFYIVCGLVILIVPQFIRELQSLWIILGLFGVSFTLKSLSPELFNGFFIELWIPFALGVLVYYHRHGSLSRTAVLCLDGGLVLFSIVSYWQMHRPDYIFSYWFASVVFALLLVVLRPYDFVLSQTFLGRRLCRFGLISYSLYLTHQFNLTASRMIADAMGVPPHMEHLTNVVRFAVLCAIATAFWYFCERPFLNTRLKRDVIDLPFSSTR